MSDRQLKLYNTLGRQVQDFVPLLDGKVGYYTCGPTVYGYAHVGNLRTFISYDVLKRTLQKIGYSVNHVMNITDVGHLVGDTGESGEDKLELGARREGKTPAEIAAFYTEAFKRDYLAVNNYLPTHLAKATDYVAQIITNVAILINKGFAYETDQAIYFDVTKATDYGRLSGQGLEDKLVSVRPEVIEDANKRQPADFAVWFKAVGHHANQLQVWDSPWGSGFPGWHIECSVIAKELLGPTVDIHTGAVDLIGTHHTNEIAQSEALNDAPFVRYWVHMGHLQINGQKMAKSAGTMFILKDLTDKGYDPLDYRYMCLSAHYRSRMDFSLDGLDVAARTLKSIRELVKEGKQAAESGEREKSELIWGAILDDLNLPKAIGLLHEAKSAALWLEFDNILGLDLKKEIVAEEIPEEINNLVEERETARVAQDWAKADELRTELLNRGYLVEDTANGPKVEKN